MGVRLKFSWQLWGGNTCYQWKILLIHFNDTLYWALTSVLMNTLRWQHLLSVKNFTDTFCWYPCIGLWPQFRWRLWGGNTCYQWKILLIQLNDSLCIGLWPQLRWILWLGNTCLSVKIFTDTPTLFSYLLLIEALGAILEIFFSYILSLDWIFLMILPNRTFTDTFQWFPSLFCVNIDIFHWYISMIPLLDHRMPDVI